jgi:hypothetical protein
LQLLIFQQALDSKLEEDCQYWLVVVRHSAACRTPGPAMKLLLRMARRLNVSGLSGLSGC